MARSVFCWVLLAAGVTLSPAKAQDVLVLAGANDNPNTLINGVFDGSTLTFNPEVPSGGSTPGQTNYLYYAQVRAYRSPAPGCSRIAQTNDGSVTIYGMDAANAIAPVAGSPFATGPDTEALAWSPDGGALYVPLYGTSTVFVYTVTCTGGVVSAAAAGTVSVTGMSSLVDAWVVGSGTGSHLCLAGRSTGNVGCFAIDAATRLPTTTPVNTVTVANARSVRFASNGCGILAIGSAALSQGVRIDAQGFLTLTNTAPSAASARFGAISADGTLAAMGTSSAGFSVYAVDSSCGLSLVGTDLTAPGDPFVLYMDFDSRNRLYVADSLENRIRIFAPGAAGIGPAIASVMTNHPRAQAPAGLDVVDLAVDALFADGFEPASSAPFRGRLPEPLPAPRAN